MKKILLVLLWLWPSVFLMAVTGNGYEVAKEGAWCWFADPRALHYANKSGTINASYIGYIDVHGNIKAMQYDFIRKRQQEVLIRSCFQPDDHDNPTFLVLPDERIMVFYSRHTDEPCFYYRVSQKAGDITTLGMEKKIPVKDNTTYPSPFILSSDPAHIYLCWRGIRWHPTIARLTLPDKSDELKIDWGPYQMVQSTGARPYCKYQSDGKDRIYLTYTTGHPDNEYPNFLYFNFVDIKKLELKDITGKFLSKISEGPFRVDKSREYAEKEPLTLVDAPADKRDWVWQVAYTKEKEPVIALVRISKDKKSHDFYYARWHNGVWRKTFIANAGGHFHQTENHEMCYSSGMAIDPTDPSVLYASLPVSGKYGRVYELFRFTIGDAGNIVSKRAVTTDSRVNNVRPYILPGSKGTPLRLAWMRGNYYDWIVSSRYPKGYPTSIICDFKGFPPALNPRAAAVPARKGQVKGMEVLNFRPQNSFVLTAELDSIPTGFRGTLLTVGAVSYQVGEGTFPEIHSNGQVFRSSNRLASSDGWWKHGRGTNGKWYNVTPLTSATLTLSFKNGILRSYVNGLLDQTIDVGRMQVNNAYLWNPEGHNRLTLRYYND